MKEEDIDNITEAIQMGMKEIDRLRGINADLLEALIKIKKANEKAQKTEDLFEVLQAIRESEPAIKKAT